MTDQTDIKQKLQEVKEIKATFMKNEQFSVAKDELTRLRKDYMDNIELAQQLAICTYKDVETAPALRFSEALKVLESIGLGSEKCDPETLRLAGAVYKRKWQFDGRLENLYQAYSLYREAADSDPDDLGYGAVNAAFILDLLSSRARVRANKTSTSQEEADRLTKQAKQLRTKTLKIMKQALIDKPKLKSDIWFLPTIAEVHFGLGLYAKTHYQAARDYLELAVKNGAKGWEAETSFRQLLSIAKAQGIQLPQKDEKESDWHLAWQTLSAYQGDNTRNALECYRGRVGLALSGGGFRASFYHIGVLARLAEMDVLRSVEVISTVSGGSIVGAHYYLEVKQLLETKSDTDIKKEDYIKIVERVQNQFFAGVSKNLRMSTFVNPIDNIRMIFNEKFSRSHRIGELYERDLYSNIGKDTASTDCDLQSRNMSDLMIKPEDAGSDHFNPNRENWRRSSRAPILLLNTTSLNSGHNWRFTARWMGEPPGVLDEKVDKNNRYQWVNYSAPGISPVRLGSAVAASACVPGLFEPLELDDIYPGHTIKLVDGGVHDNQGVAGLLDEGCTLILCSDSSGQMGSNANPGSTLLGVPLRSNEILMDRVRETQYQNLKTRVDSRAIEGLFFTHLKDDIDVNHIHPRGSSGHIHKQTETGYGIHPEIQKKIAALRTDLDCFSEVEAQALMLSGYKMTQWHFNNLQSEHEKSGEPGNWGDFDVHADGRETPQAWSFLDPDFIQIANRSPDNNPASKELADQLDIGSSLFFKVFSAVKPLKLIGLAILALLAFACFGWIVSNWDNSLFSFSVGQITLVIIVLVITLLWPAIKWLNPQSVIQNKLWLIFIGLAGSIVSLVQVKLLDNYFQEFGKLKKLKSLFRK